MRRLMSKNPVISVLMAINKDDGFFDLAVESILKQTYEDFELILVANNCEDKLWHHINSLNDIRVKKHRIEIGGLTNALNYGITKSLGKYIARMDADDISLPNRLKNQLNFMEKNPNIDILGAKTKLINQNGNFISEKLRFYEVDKEIKKIMPFRNPMAHPSIFIKRDVLLKAGGYKYGFTGEDYELWIRLMLQGCVFHNLDEVLLYYRRHEFQMTDKNNSNINYSDIINILIIYYVKSKKFKFLLGAILKHRYSMSLYKMFK